MIDLTPLECLRVQKKGIEYQMIHGGLTQEEHQQQQARLNEYDYIIEAIEHKYFNFLTWNGAWDNIDES